MPDRPIIYSMEVPRSFDVLSFGKDFLYGVGNISRALLGGINTIASGLSAAAQGTPNMTVNLADGNIFSWAAADSTPYGSLAADATFVVQQGYTAAQVLTFSTAALIAGQSQWALVQAKFLQQDLIRTGDPTGGVLAFYNSSNPQNPLQGQNGLGATLPSVRNAFCQISIKYGSPATTGTEVAPSPDAGAVGLYLVDLSFGQTAITNGQILVASPTAGAGGTTSAVPQAPFLPGLTGRHHLGNSLGQAPQISLTQEVAGVLPLGNLPASNTVGVLPTIRFGTTSPSGVTAGNIDDLFFNTVVSSLYVCTATGTAGTAVWAQVGQAGVALQTSTFPINPVIGGYIYLCNTNAGAGSAQLQASGTYGGVPVQFINIGTNPMTITPFSGESINFLAANATVTISKGDSLKLVPGTATWFVG